jgi:carboxyl-terminal processing protease
LTDNPEISEAGLKNPLPWDAVPSALYAHFNLVEPYLAKLRENSSARVASDRDFKWLKEDLALIAENRDRKSVSLNEAERRKERDETKARVKAREAEKSTHREETPATYEITVENSGNPGLPAPLDSKKLKAENSAAENEDTDDATSSAPAEDLQLRETEHILADYVNFLTGSSLQAATTGGRAHSG